MKVLFPTPRAPTTAIQMSRVELFDDIYIAQEKIQRIGECQLSGDHALTRI
jgi:hypothetical protein